MSLEFTRGTNVKTEAGSGAAIAEEEKGKAVLEDRMEIRLTMFENEEEWDKYRKGALVSSTGQKASKKKTEAEEERIRMVKTLSDRVDRIMEDLAARCTNEDYVLKTVYALIRHCLHYAENDKLFLQMEVDLMNRLLSLCTGGFEYSGCYGGFARDRCMERAIFDSIVYICFGFPQMFNDRNYMWIGAFDDIPGGCSPLYTDLTDYESFRSGLKDYDYWEEDPGEEGEMVFPTQPVDHTDDEIVTMYGTLTWPC